MCAHADSSPWPCDISECLGSMSSLTMQTSPVSSIIMQESTRDRKFSSDVDSDCSTSPDAADRVPSSSDSSDAEERPQKVRRSCHPSSPPAAQPSLLSSRLASVEDFESAVAFIRQLPAKGPYLPNDQTRLAFYKYFKQATVGPCSEHCPVRPCLTKPEQRAKWEAWSSLDDMPREQAKTTYVALLQAVGKAACGDKF
eukprot:TRINITY_DN2732_c0_g1_i4.p1 TRINITY_DN2732_c0_g1~~TRINITY_DN2732_c0_g1_i4.p1  ORF type:complete len:198 (+),score=40.59 TRINITY_DN2732_c0_g1_i4:441-1034(+)